MKKVFLSLLICVLFAGSAFAAISDSTQQMIDAIQKDMQSQQGADYTDATLIEEFLSDYLSIFIEFPYKYGEYIDREGVRYSPVLYHPRIMYLWLGIPQLGKQPHKLASRSFHMGQ